MAYQYVAYTKQGELVQGRIEANSERAAEENLWQLGYTVTTLREAHESSGKVFGSSRVNTRDLIVFSRQLATLIESGIPIVRALQLLQEQVPKALATILTEMIQDVQQGRFLSEAVGKHPKTFSNLYIRLIEVGERTGNLEMVLRQLAVYMEKADALKHKIRSAMSYPSFVFVLMIVVVFVMLTVALPPMMGLFTSFDAELPLPTRILLALTNFFSKWKYLILAGLVAGAAALVLAFRSEAGRLFFDGLMLKVPVLKRVVIQGAVARMCRSITTLLRAGLALPEILSMVIRSESNRIISGDLEEVRSDLLQGHGLADPLAEHKIFPRMLVQMVRVGEETGALDGNMETLAVFYEEEVDRAVAAMAATIEPAMTIIIGLGVGFIALAVIMPMYSLMGAIK